MNPIQIAWDMIRYKPTENKMLIIDDSRVYFQQFSFKESPPDATTCEINKDLITLSFV